MYDGKQVVRVETKFKQKDLYNIGIEMKDRKGTGNYDIERREFNVEYISMSERNLYQEVQSHQEQCYFSCFQVQLFSSSVA